MLFHSAQQCDANCCLVELSEKVNGEQKPTASQGTLPKGWQKPSFRLRCIAIHAGADGFGLGLVKTFCDGHSPPVGSLDSSFR